MLFGSNFAIFPHQWVYVKAQILIFCCFCFQWHLYWWSTQQAVKCLRCKLRTKFQRQAWFLAIWEKGMAIFKNFFRMALACNLWMVLLSVGWGTGVPSSGKSVWKCDMNFLNFESARKLILQSKANEGEVGLVVAHVDSLVSSGLDPSEIAVVTPYNLQVFFSFFTI